MLDLHLHGQWIRSACRTHRCTRHQQPPGETNSLGGVSKVSRNADSWLFLEREKAEAGCGVSCASETRLIPHRWGGTRSSLLLLSKHGGHNRFQSCRMSIPQWEESCGSHPLAEMDRRRNFLRQLTLPSAHRACQVTARERLGQRDFEKDFVAGPSSTRVLRGTGTGGVRGLRALSSIREGGTRPRLKVSTPPAPGIPGDRPERTDCTPRRPRASRARAGAACPWMQT